MVNCKNIYGLPQKNPSKSVKKLKNHKFISNAKNAIKMRKCDKNAINAKNVIKMQ
jgi:hypothetical protein